MSHCTRFAFSYQDEALAVQCFRRLGLEPSIDVICSYDSDFAKSFLSRLGYAGSSQQRAIIAAAHDYQYFLCKEGDEYKLHMEKAGALSRSDIDTMRDMEAEFRLTYVQLALEQLAERLEAQGMPTRFVREQASLTLQFGPAFDRAVKMTLAGGEHIDEEVSGVSGPSCADLTAELENLLSLESSELTTSWKSEYRQEIDDEVVQVLRLQS